MEVEGLPEAQVAQDGIGEEEAALYDRQLRLWGLEAQNRMRNASVLVVNFRGIATEVCKNIVLAGTGSVTILDDQDVDEEDLGAGFFMREAEVGQKRVHAAKERINALNPRVSIVAETDLSKLEDDAFLLTFNMICLTDSDSLSITRLNNRCRKLGKPFYVASSMGLHGYIFADLLHHEYLIDTETTLPSGEVKKSSAKKEQDFVPFEEALRAPWTTPPRRLKKVSKMMWVCLGIFAYQRQHASKSPEVASDAPVVSAIATPLLRSLNVDPSLLSDSLLESVCSMGTAEFIPTCALLGAILSQDVLNALGGKEPPIVNFFVWDGEVGSGDIYALGVKRT